MRIPKLDLKLSEVCCDQTFHISPFAKFIKFDKKSPTFIAVKIFVFDWHYAKFEKLDVKEVGEKISEISEVSDLSKFSI